MRWTVGIVTAAATLVVLVFLFNWAIHAGESWSHWVVGR